MTPMRRNQRGVTLLMGIIMLLLLAIIAVATFNAGKGSLQIVGNLQQHNQVIAAAQEAIEEAVSTTRLFTTPGAILANPCNGVPNTRCVDINGDTVNDVTVTLTPTPSCIQAHVATLSLPQDVGCIKGIDPDGNIVSGCTDTLWNVRAVATDNVTNASTAVNQGVAVRMLTVDATANCP
jgi:Tfp pilus assembly protein PilX